MRTLSSKSQEINTINSEAQTENHIEHFVCFHLKGLTPEHQDRFLQLYEILKEVDSALPEHEVLGRLGAMLKQFEDEHQYLSPQLLAQLRFMSEENIQRFTQEIKRLSEMRPVERESYLSDNEGFKQRELQLGISERVKEALLILGLTYPCSMDDVKQAYRQLAKTYHPDQGGDTRSFMKIQTAYQMAVKDMMV